MASTIAALTTGGGGIATSADASGNLSLLSGATTVVAVTATGATVTGTLAATGASTFTGTGKFATTIGVGNATPAASGSGITFPASQSASSDANTLDDYEEGTYTVTALSAIGSITSYTAYGTYTKIGRQVFLSANVNVITAGTASGVLIISIPFTSPNTANQFFYGVGSETLATGTGYQVYIAPNAANANMVTYAGTAGVTYANGRNFAFNMNYFVS